MPVNKAAGELLVLLVHQARGPSNTNEKAVRPANPNFVQSPFPVAQDAARADDEVIDPLGNGIDVRSADENTKGIILFRHLPRTASRLRQMHFAVPTRHDNV